MGGKRLTLIGTTRPGSRLPFLRQIFHERDNPMEERRNKIRKAARRHPHKRVFFLIGQPWFTIMLLLAEPVANVERRQLQAHGTSIARGWEGAQGRHRGAPAVDMGNAELGQVTELDILRDVDEEGGCAKGLGGVVLYNQ
jgi:hypothetical protein